MSLIAFVLFGLVAGFVASQLVHHRGSGTVVDIVLGLVGSVVGGFVFNVFGATGVTGLNVWSLLVAVIGASLMLGVYHAVVRRGVAT